MRTPQKTLPCAWTSTYWNPARLSGGGATPSPKQRMVPLVRSPQTPSVPNASAAYPVVASSSPPPTSGAPWPQHESAPDVDSAHARRPCAATTSKLPPSGAELTASVSLPKHRMDAGRAAWMAHTNQSPTATETNRSPSGIFSPRHRQQWSSPLESTPQTRYPPEDSAWIGGPRYTLFDLPPPSFVPFVSGVFVRFLDRSHHRIATSPARSADGPTAQRKWSPPASAEKGCDDGYVSCRSWSPPASVQLRSTSSGDAADGSSAHTIVVDSALAMAKVDKVFDAAVRRRSSTGSKNTRRRAPPWPWRRDGGIGERSGRRRGGRRSKGAGGWTWTWQGTTTQASVRN
ncbi:Os11g0222100, partial [Oryza sativa Japonica Group]